MDVLSLVGIILAFVAIVGGNFLEGGHAGPCSTVRRR